jgi:hypothetical protein
VYLGLLLIPDFVAVGIYTVFGFGVKKSRSQAVVFEEEASKPQEYEMGTQMGQGYEMGPPQGIGVMAGNKDGRQPRAGRRSRRRRGPIHMLYYAIAGRGE